MEFWTIGHSTHSFEEFVALLDRHGIETVADVRTVPKSRRVPWFNTEELAVTLPAHSPRALAYTHFKNLGGWRHAAKDSPNLGWTNTSFRGYADYTLTPDFAAALDELVALGSRSRTAFMCAEALWWRCHRRIISDYLLAAGHEVAHIGSDGGLTPHKLTEFAVVEAPGHIVYPPLEEKEDDGGGRQLRLGDN